MSGKKSPWISSASVASLLIEWAENCNASLLLADGGEYKDLPTFKVALKLYCQQQDIRGFHYCKAKMILKKNNKMQFSLILFQQQETQITVSVLSLIICSFKWMGS